MTTMFEERERAAEYGFAHGEQLRFLAVREGIETLGAWAANRMELHDEAAYARDLVAAYLGGTPEAALLDRVQTDLGHSGFAGAASQASAVLARTIAAATDRQRGTSRGQSVGHLAASVGGSTDPSPHHPHGFWGWDVDGR